MSRAAPPGERRFGISLAVYRLLLRTYPPSFRRRFAADLLEDFDSLLRDHGAAGLVRGRLAAWRLILRDLGASVPREWVHGRSRPRNRRKEEPMGSLAFDLRHALRALRRSPVFALVTVAVLAVGIAANAATFSLVRHILLRPPPFDHPERLVSVSESIPQAGIEGFAFSAPDLLDLEDYQRSFDVVAAYNTKEVELSGGADPERLLAARLTHDLLPLLGAEPAIGRVFVAEEDVPGSDVVLLDYGFWQRRFGGSPAVLGHSIVLDRRPLTVIGVMPESFSFPLEHMPEHGRPAELFVPMAFTEVERRGRGMMHNNAVIARLAPGVSFERARADLEQVAERIHANYPPVVRERYDLELVATPLRDAIVGEAQRPLLMLLAAMGLVLVVVCANVANLALTRASGRRAELALRAAMGAGRARVAQVLLLESLVLALSAGVLAAALAKLVVAAVVARLGPSLPLGSTIAVDGGVLAFTFGVTLLAAVVSGWAPFFFQGTERLESALREGSAKATPGRGVLRVQRVLVVTTVAMAVVLLVGAGLLVRSFARLTGTDAGFHRQDVLTLQVTLPTDAYPEAAQVRGFVDALQERLSALPGVQKASLATSLPMSYGEIRAMAAERPVDGGAPRSVVVTWSEGPYFETLGIPLRAGRTLQSADRHAATQVALVSESLARDLWGEGYPLGQRIQWGVGASSRAPWMEVVGVVGDVHDGPLGSEPRPHVYVPFAQLADAELDQGVAVGSTWGRSFYLALLAPGDPTRLTGAAVATLRELDSSLPATDISTMARVVAEGVAPQRFSMAVVSAFGAVALALAAVGLYGILAYGVARRRREIGLRVALGADRLRVVRSVVGEGMVPVLLGLAVGLLAAAALARLMPAVLFETRALDPWVFAAAPLVLLVSAAAASLLPALRAGRVDPMRALRLE
jgi:predicted permease